MNLSQIGHSTKKFSTLNKVNIFMNALTVTLYVRSVYETLLDNKCKTYNFALTTNCLSEIIQNCYLHAH